MNRRQSTHRHPARVQILGVFSKMEKGWTSIQAVICDLSEQTLFLGIIVLIVEPYVDVR